MYVCITGIPLAYCYICCTSVVCVLGEPLHCAKTSLICHRSGLGADSWRWLYYLTHLCGWLLYLIMWATLMLPSVLSRCWLGSRKSIRPVKIWSDDVLAWLSVCSEVQMICMWFSWCHCHLVMCCFSKIQNGLALRCCLHRLSWKKGR